MQVTMSMNEYNELKEKADKFTKIDNAVKTNFIDIEDPKTGYVVDWHINMQKPISIDFRELSDALNLQKYFEDYFNMQWPKKIDIEINT